jgi:hypothetical protein
MLFRILRSAVLTSTFCVTSSFAQSMPLAPPSSSLEYGGANTAAADAAESETVTSSPSATRNTPWDGYYLDPGRGPAPFEPEYERWFGKSRRPARYGRAAIELAGVLAVGTSYYWIVSDPNKQDWDYIDLRDRSLHVEVKFDNNMFRTNFLLHSLAGTMSYWLSRANGLDVYRSSGAAFLSSAVFELLLEWLEKPSINDLVTTPLGGVAAGEFFFHLGDYLNSAFGHDNAVQRVLAYSVGAPQGIHSAMDAVDAPLGTRDALGYSVAYWHQFGVGYGIADVANDRGARGTVHDLLFDAKLVAMPGFLQPGRFSVNFNQGNFTEARLRTSIADGLLQDVDLWFGSDLVGHYRQSYEGTPTALVGSGAMLAASVDMRYVDRWLLNRRDQFAMFHFLGPSAKVWFGLGGGLMAYADARLHLDFAGVTSPAYKQLVAQRGAEGTKTVLQLQDYYQGFGGSGRFAASVRLAGFELGGHFRYGAYRSIDGLDRFATAVDVMNADQIIELGAGLSYSPPAAPLSLRMGWESIEHRSQMEPFSVSWRDRRAAVSGMVRF